MKNIKKALAMGIHIITLIFIIYIILNVSSSEFLKKMVIDNIEGKNIIEYSQAFKYITPEIVYKDLNSDMTAIEGNDKPIIYLYNTHQTERYDSINNFEYNINPTVITASYIFKEELANKGINSLVETNSVKKVLNQNKWKYGYSYKVSRMFLEKAKEKNPSLKYYIDIHRDSGTHSKTTLTYNNKNYAKVLLVVGLDYENYEINLKNATTLHNIINSRLDGLSRGVLKKSGKGVNGIYNQDFAKNVFLIEVGGEYNNIEEVKNTIYVLADAINDYITLNDEKEKT